MNHLPGTASRILLIATLMAAALAGCVSTPKPLTPVSANDPEMKAVAAELDKMQEKRVALIDKELEELKVTPAQHDAFWREYYAYFQEMKKGYEERYQIVRDYAANYDNMSDEIADNLSLRALKFRDDRNDLFRKYYNRLKKATSATIAGVFLQIENELNLLYDLRFSTSTPLLPNESKPAAGK